jgi:hypothetical protein
MRLQRPDIMPRLMRSSPLAGRASVHRICGDAGSVSPGWTMTNSPVRGFGLA